MIRYEQDGTLVIMGDDLPDVVRWLEATPREWSSNESVTQDRNFNGGASWDDALEMARVGWSKGAEQIHHNLSALPVPVNTHADIRYDVGGQLPDIGRFLAGDPAHMITKGKRAGNPPIVHLIVNVVCSGATTAEAFIAYGTALISMVDQLESKGHRVELDVVTVNTFEGKGRGIFGWKVKRADDHCDLAAIAFSIGHPAAYRRFGFAMWERSAARLYCGLGYGTCAKLQPNDRALLNSPDALLLGGIGTSYFRGQRDMLGLAAEQINKAAGETLVEVEG